jgi:hypothetical protein
MYEITLRDKSTMEIDNYPNKCPYCHHIIEPNKIAENFSSVEEHTAELIFRCPNLECNRSFIGFYQTYDGNTFKFKGCNFGNYQKKIFSNEIKKISPSFEKIFNEASFAEQNNLMEICGVGYRKGIEFLIKDYLIKNNPLLEEEIKKTFLGACIKDYVADARIKKVSARAVWLGNDETHYIRKWETHTLQDLKKLIDLVVHWIEMEEITNSLDITMPES